MSADEQDSDKEFAQMAGSKAPSIVGEFWAFMFTHKKWWLLPIVLMLLALGILLFLGSTGAAPFIYTLF